MFKIIETRNKTEVEDIFNNEEIEILKFSVTPIAFPDNTYIIIYTLVIQHDSETIAKPEL